MTREEIEKIAEELQFETGNHFEMHDPLSRCCLDEIVSALVRVYDQAIEEAAKELDKADWSGGPTEYSTMVRLLKLTGKGK